jgi:catechol 2,3-dioxygenase-like lactoylglutathione lyase family enzyme
MPLADTPVGPVIPVRNLDAAQDFYESKLGLQGRETPGGYRLAAGGESAIYLLPVDFETGETRWPLASFLVENIATHVAELRDRGVVFMTDDELPFDVGEDGISRQDGMAVAWMRDPDGHVLTLFELG